MGRARAEHQPGRDAVQTPRPDARHVHRGVREQRRVRRRVRAEGRRENTSARPSVHVRRAESHPRQSQNTELHAAAKGLQPIGVSLPPPSQWRFVAPGGQQ